MTRPVDSPTWAAMRQARADALTESWMLRADHPATHRWHDRADCLGCRTIDTTLCTTCPVRLDCLRDAYTLERDNLEAVHDIRGGLTAAERADWYRTNTPAAPAHSATAYRGGCRCDVCREAHRVDTAERRRRAGRPSRAKKKVA